MYSYVYPQAYNYDNYPAYCNAHTQIPSEKGYQSLNEATLRERIQALAERRARKAQWLPDEVDNSDDDLEYNQLGPREHAYLDALRKHQMAERMQRQQEAQALEAARQRRQQEQKWQQELEKLQREDDRSRRELLEKKKREMAARHSDAGGHEMKLNQHRQHERTRSKEGPIPINIRRTPSPQSTRPHPETEAVPESRSQSPSKPIYTERHVSAASRIQKQYRLHTSHRILNNIATQFQTLKQNFVYPSVIDFQKPGSDDGHITVHVNQAPSLIDDETSEELSLEADEVGKLAFTSANYALHTYADAMEKLVIKLDGVNSLGDKRVREKRRSIVREISKESAKLEGYWKRAWSDYVEKQKEEVRQLELEKEDEMELVKAESQAMDIDEEPVHVEHHEAKDDVDEWFDVAESGRVPDEQTSQFEHIDLINQSTPDIQSIEHGVDPTSLAPEFQDPSDAEDKTSNCK